MSPYQSYTTPKFTPAGSAAAHQMELEGFNPYEAADSGFEHGSMPQTTGSTISMDELTKIFNSAIVSTRAEANRDFSTELYQLVQTPAFSAILSAIRLLSRSQGISETTAAEQVITTFRKLDAVWADYLFQEGVDRVRGQTTQTTSG